MFELVKSFSGDDARYGITTVQPDRATKRCRIRSIRVEYFLTKIAVILVTPKCCTNCELRDNCTDEFVQQIVQKYNDRHQGSELYYIL